MSWLDWIILPLQYTFMQRALLAALMVGLVCSVLSCYLLVKRWALLGDAISHAVLPGVAFAYLLKMNFFIGAVMAGILTALGIGFVERHSRIKEDAAMGIMFTAAFALGILVLSIVRSKSIDLYHILFGNVLGVSNTDLWLTAITGTIVLIVIALFYKELLLWSFDPIMAQAIGLPTQKLHYLLMVLLSLTIVASLQTVGIVLVVAMLITPGAMAYLLAERLPKMMIFAALGGMISALLGLYLSFYGNVASGPTMVLVSCILFALAFFFSPRHGLIWRAIQRRRSSLLIKVEDYLKHIYSLQRLHPMVPLITLSEQLAVSSSSLKSMLRKLSGMGLIQVSDNAVQLTKEGQDRALQIIRSHRLWERYLTDEAGLAWDVVHQEAQKLEHITPQELADQLDEILGKPTFDPHGAPIPTKEGLLKEVPTVPLIELNPGQPAIIVIIRDEYPDVLNQLANLGIFPNTSIILKERNAMDGSLCVQVGSKEHILTLEAAANIFVTTTLRDL